MTATATTTVLGEDPRQFDYVHEAPTHNRLWHERYMLFIEDVTAVFDGFKALDIKALGIGHNELRVVVGPNGAGKTTMCDVVSGMTKPTTGKVYFDGEEITSMTEANIAQRGVGRKFQIPNVFDSLTVYENMLLCLPKLRRDKTVFITPYGDVERLFITERVGPLMFDIYDAFRYAGGLGTRANREKIDAILERVRLIDHKDMLAKNLSHGQRQWLAISSLILADPKLLLVDEPAAGLTDAETELTGELLLELKNDHTLIVIEHDMDFVRQLGSRVTVLNEGQVLAEGSMDEVSTNEDVIEAYLGR